MLLAVGLGMSCATEPATEADLLLDESLENPIIGGAEAKPGEYPWMVAVFFDYGGGEWLQGCGGTLIDERHVVTAAHCFVDVESVGRNQELWYPAAPETRRVALRPQSTAAVTPEQLLEIEEVYVYQYYEAGGDVAVLRLKVPVTGIKNFPRLATAEETTRMEDIRRRVRVIGYGLTDSNGADTSEVLMKVDVPLVPLEECQDQYSDLYPGTPPEEVVTKEELCAGLDEGGKDSCAGDSGGPLFVRANAPNPILVGVVSWGFGCAEPAAPGIYARVSNFDWWIEACQRGECDNMPPFTRCAFSYGDCDGNPENGCEADTWSASHCGACGKSCGAEEACVIPQGGGEMVCAAAKPLTPTLECTFTREDGTKVASYGYSNENAGWVSVPAGPNNRLTGVADYSEEPGVFPGIEYFQAGAFKRAPVVELSGTEPASWLLKGPDGQARTVTQTAETPVCDVDPTTLPGHESRAVRILKRLHLLSGRPF